MQLQRSVLLQEIKEHRKEAARCNTPGMFSKHALALRKAAAKEKELAALHEQPKDPWNRDWQDQVAMAAKTLQVCSAVQGVQLLN